MKFCDRPFTSAYLAPHGEVWPCSWMHCTMGNLYEQNLDEIWNSAAAQAARSSILDGSFAFCRAISCPFMERDELPDLSEEEIRERAVPLKTPAHISISNDRTCNIACTSCRTCIQGPEKGEREKIDAALERLLPFANQAKTLSMNGQGEFLANPSFLRFLNKLRPVHDDFKVAFETNGILFDEAHWTQFADLGKYTVSVTVTLNSLRRDVFRYLSGGFDKLGQELSNLRFLSRLRRENKINVLSVTMVVQECNFWEVPEYIRTFTRSEEYAADRIVMKPIYSWFKIDPETYWFKNILNPLHPYHQEYLNILADDGWNDPKVYDWGCHNLREPMPHPLHQTKIYNRLLLDIYQNSEGLSAVEYLKARLERTGIRRVGFYGKNEFAQMMGRLLREAGADVFQLTWTGDEAGEIPKISKQSFRPEMTDLILIIDSHKGGYWFKDLPALGFKGPVLTMEEFIEGRKP